MAEAKKLSHPILKTPPLKVIFYNPKDHQFGWSITVDVTDEKVRQQIAEWVKENNIGKNNPGVANFKEYTPDGGDKVYQYTFKINDHTSIASIDGPKDDEAPDAGLGYGAMVRIVAGAYVYNNNFSGGKDMVGQSAQAVLILSPAAGAGAAALEELIAEEKSKEAESPDAEIDVSEIPF